MTKREAPILFLRSVAGSLVPASAYDSELVDALPKGVDLEISVKHRKRSLPQLRAYWAGLHELVKATECYPTAEHLHEAIKCYLGYMKPLITIDGREMFVPDSAAFEAMDATEFKTFLDRALKLCLETWGFNIMGKEEREVV